MSQNPVIIHPLAMGYSEAGASHERRALKGFNAKSASPIEDIDANNGTLRQRSRMLFMSSPLATSAINTNRTKIVGTGLSLKADIDRDILGMEDEKQAKEWQTRTEKEFAVWAGKKNHCDALGMNNFNGLQQLALKSWLMSGDVFAVITRGDTTPMNPYSLRIHLIEADRVNTPSWAVGNGANYFTKEGRVPKDKPGAGNAIHDGIEVDKDGRIVAYYFSDTYPNSLGYDGTTNWNRVEAYDKNTGLPNVLHVMDSERPEQYRGVPYLAPVIEPLLQMRRYTESELMAALVQSFFTAWIQTEGDTSEFPVNETIDDFGGEGARKSDVKTSENEYQMGMGTVIHLAPGENVVFGEPKIPTAGFDVFVKTVAKQIGTALELPYDVLMKEFNSSYSASRGALLEAWEALKMRRQWFNEGFCQPIYEIWLAEAVARGRIKAPGFFDDPLIRAAWSGAHWIGPVQGQLDPKKEAQAALALASYGIKTYSQITRELGGGDFFENVEQLKSENDLLHEAGALMEEVDLEEEDEVSDGDEDQP